MIILPDWVSAHGNLAAVAVAAVPTTPIAWFSTHRRWAIGILIAAALATTVGLGIYRADRSGSDNILAQQNIGQRLGDGIKAVGNSVASLFDARSPGERAGGALASLKHRRQPLLHQRALPKVRGRPAPRRAIAAAIPPAAGVETPPAAAPLYNILSGAPEALPTTVASAAPPLGGFPGGGGFIIGSPGGGGVPVTPGAPITPGAPGTPGTPGIPGIPGTPGTPGTPGIPGVPGTPGTPDTPGTVNPTSPGTPAVPEPSSWAMMLIGFALIGHSIGSGRRTTALALRHR